MGNILGNDWVRKQLSNPSVLNSAGVLAVALKFLFSILFFTLSSVLLDKRLSVILIVVLYPFVGVVVDAALYLLKDRIWIFFPKATSIPEDWHLSPAELLRYAKELPKVRLMRVFTCWIFLPFISYSEHFNEVLFLKIITALSIGFFVSALFDSTWLKYFKIKKPFSVKSEYALPSIDEELELSGRDTDATYPGSSAWVAAEIARETNNRSRFPE